MTPTQGSPSHQQGLMALYTATIILAINGVLSKAIPLNAVTITCLRCAIAFCALAALLKLQRSQNLFRFKDNRSYGFVIIVGGLMALHWTSFFHAMQISTVAIGILAHYSFPVITVIVEPLLDKQRPKMADLFAGIIVLVGVALMVPSWNLQESAFLGVLFGLVSAVAWATRNIVQRRCLGQESGQGVMTYQLLVIIVLTLGFSDWEAVSHVTPNVWLMLLLLGVVSTALGHTLFAISLRVISAKSVSLISCMQPPLAIALSWLFLQEIPTINTVMGGSLILMIAFYEAIKIKASPINNTP